MVKTQSPNKLCLPIVMCVCVCFSLSLSTTTTTINNQNVNQAEKFPYIHQDQRFLMMQAHREWGALTACVIVNLIQRWRNRKKNEPLSWKWKTIRYRFEKEGTSKIIYINRPCHVHTSKKRKDWIFHSLPVAFCSLALSSSWFSFIC